MADHTAMKTCKAEAIKRGDRALPRTCPRCGVGACSAGYSISVVDGEYVVTKAGPSKDGLWHSADQPPEANEMPADDPLLVQSRPVVYVRCRKRDPGAEPFGALWVLGWGTGDADIPPGWMSADGHPFDAFPGDKWADLPPVEPT